MAKRTPGLELVSTILPKSIHALGPKVEGLYRRYYVLWHWKDIVGEAIASNVQPMGIEHGKLWLYAPNPSWRNELQMMQWEILQKVNNFAGERLVKEMHFGRKWERPPVSGREETTESKEEFHLGKILNKVNLSNSKIRKIEEECIFVEDDSLRKKMQNLLLKEEKLKALKEHKGWHSCADCDALCPEEEERCSICERRYREKIRRKVRRLLHELPWLRYGEILEQVPECTPYLVNSTRASMVQEWAGKVKLKEVDSLAAKRLVMLYLCLPPEQLTEDVTRRTLYQLRRDLLKPEEFEPVKRYDYLRKGRGRRVPPSGK